MTAPTTDEGVRLAKRVAAMAGVSRREAELLIENGAVSVDGQPALLPQSR
ncbi:MAG: RNA-binding protein, partial [Variovorax sp.]